MEELAILFILCIIYVSQAVDYCPKNASMWKEREASFSINCGRNKFYHCLKDENHRVEESCHERSWVQPGFCPEFNSVANEIDVFLCQESMGKCPEATYWSNELYRYSACLKAVNAVQDSKHRENGTSSDNVGKTNGGGDAILIIISSITSAIVVVIVIVIIVVIVIVHCFRRKRNTENQGDDRELKPLNTDESNVNVDTATSHMLQETHRDRDKESNGSSVLGKTISRESTPEDVKTNPEEDKFGLHNANRTIIKPGEINSWIDQHLRKHRKIVVLIVHLQKNIPIVEHELRNKPPGFLAINSFDKWSMTSGREGYYVLLSCVMKEFSLAGNLDKHRHSLRKIASDIETLKLRAVIPIRSDNMEESGHTLHSYHLFQNLDQIFELENT